MTTAQLAMANLAQVLSEQLDQRWRRPDLTFQVSASPERLVLTIAPLESGGCYPLKHHLPASELLALQREGGLGDLVTAILRSADRLSTVVAA